jgi:hypothetical protein
MMNLWRATGVALLCLMMAAGSATASSQCVTAAGLVAFLKQQAPVATVQHLGGDGARLVLASLAEVTNTTAPEADAAIIVDLSPELPVMKIVVFRAGCLDRVGTFSRRAMERALNALSRAGA